MWLVTGDDEEHRFPDWGRAVDYYRQMVQGWVGAHGDDAGATRALADLPTGGSHEAVFADPDGPDREVRFSLGWEVPRVGLDHYTAC
jgi:hypothetical protein